MFCFQYGAHSKYVSMLYCKSNCDYHQILKIQTKPSPDIGSSPMNSEEWRRTEWINMLQLFNKVTATITACYQTMDVLFFFYINFWPLFRVHVQSPSYISDWIQLHTFCSLRSPGQRLLLVPHLHFKFWGDRFFWAGAPRLWTALTLLFKVCPKDPVIQTGF